MWIWILRRVYRILVFAEDFDSLQTALRKESVSSEPPVLSTDTSRNFEKLFNVCTQGVISVSGTCHEGPACQRSSQYRIPHIVSGDICFGHLPPRRTCSLSTFSQHTVYIHFAHFFRCGSFNFLDLFLERVPSRIVVLFSLNSTQANLLAVVRRVVLHHPP